MPLASMNNCSSGPHYISFRVMESKVCLGSFSGHVLDPMPVTTRIPYAVSATILFTVHLVSSWAPCQYMGPHSVNPEGFDHA